MLIKGIKDINGNVRAPSAGFLMQDGFKDMLRHIGLLSHLAIL